MMFISALGFGGSVNVCSMRMAGMVGDGESFELFREIPMYRASSCEEP